MLGWPGFWIGIAGREVAYQKTLPMFPYRFAIPTRARYQRCLCEEGFIHEFSSEIREDSSTLRAESEGKNRHSALLCEPMQ